MQYQQKRDGNQGIDQSSRRPMDKRSQVPGAKNVTYHNSNFWEYSRDKPSQLNYSQTGEYIPLRYPAYRIADIAQSYIDQQQFSQSEARFPSNIHAKDRSSKVGNAYYTNPNENQNIRPPKFNDPRKITNKEDSHISTGKDGFTSKRGTYKIDGNNISQPQEIYTTPIEKRTGISNDKHSNELDGYNKSSNKGTYRNQIKLPTSPSPQNITEEDKFNLHMAILGLYKDRIQPNIIEIRYKLNEANNNMINSEQFLFFYLSHESLYEVRINDGTIENIYLKSTPPWFKGWIDIKDPYNCFPQSIWELFLIFLKEKRPSIPLKEGIKCKYSARYKLAQDFKKHEASFLKKYSLGEIYHFIELSILNGVLTYENDFIIPSFSSKWIAYSTIDPEIFSSESELPTDPLFVTNLHHLSRMIIDLIISSSQGFIYLSKLKLKLYKKYKLIVNPSIFKFSKLEELISHCFIGQIILESYRNHTIVMIDPEFYFNVKEPCQEFRENILPKTISKEDLFMRLKRETTTPYLYEQIKCINTPPRSIVMDHWKYFKHTTKMKYTPYTLNLPSPSFNKEQAITLESDENNFPDNKNLEFEKHDEFTSSNLFSNTIDTLRLSKYLSIPPKQTKGPLESQLTHSSQKFYQFIYLKNDTFLPDVITLISQFTDTHMNSDFQCLLRYYSKLANFSTYQFPLNSNPLDHFDQSSTSDTASYQEEQPQISPTNQYPHPIDNNLSRRTGANSTHTSALHKPLNYSNYHREDKNLNKTSRQSFLTDSQQVHHSFLTQSEDDFFESSDLNFQEIKRHSQISC